MDRSELLAVIEKAKQSGQKSLYLSHQWIEELPPEVGQLTNLTSLDLYNNRLTTLLESIGQLTNLAFLNLTSNRLTMLPEAIGQLTNLTSFNLRNNQLTALPEAIAQLTNLTFLKLNNNQLTTLPEAIAQLTNLTSLDLSNNQLTTLPEAIVQLTNLTSLDLSNNQLTTLPEAIVQLINLTSLDLSNNQLTTLPEAIGKLSKLEILELGYNQLELLPESIGEIQHLRELKATKNKLTSLPTSLINLARLSLLTISSNKLDLPPEIARKRKPESILEFLRQRQEEGEEYIYEAKLVIIGEGGAGKTSLANKLIDFNYPLKLEGSQSPEKSTEGIDVLRLDFDHPSGNPFRINLWDFGGQEIYHATHQFFLTKRSLYLLVADTRQDNTDFNYWLEVIELLTEGSPTIIIKNEKQDRPCQINENQLHGRFPNQLKEILPTNLADNRGLSKILTIIQNRISELDHIGDPLPKTWVNVRKALETDNRNYISQQEFLDLCDTHGFKRREDKLQLSGYLHDLGVCLHFQDDAILKNYIILKPEWGTTSVYKALDTPKVQKSLGRFTYADLAEIWATDEYADMRDELLQLMMTFKLCYEIPHRPRTYIAPQLLSPNQPEYFWDASDNLILRYRYEFMPKGMLTRFIVEMHKLIDGDLVWKEGVILRDNNVRAEVIEAYYKNEIRIRISGNIKKPFLESIRHEFRKIHNSYGERLCYKEYIPCNCSVCKGSQKPHQYVLSKLYEYLENKRQTVDCDKKPYEEVKVRSLIDDSIGVEASRNQLAKADRPNIDIHIGDRIKGDKINSDKVEGNKTEHR